jgi:3-phosphoinositide dependent protein kinase-1
MLTQAAPPLAAPLRVTASRRPPGSKASDYVFGDNLGTGAFSKVVRAQLIGPTTIDEYAVKIMNIPFILKERKQAAVKVEQTLLAHTSHRNIVMLKASFIDHHLIFLVMELCSGGHLLSLIDRVTAANTERAISKGIDAVIVRQLFAEIISALEYLHGRGWVHRDLKPENILLTAGGHVKLADFGSAFNELTDADRSTEFVGTALYVSPEVLDNKRASALCDLWGAGCTLYHMSTGHPPFEGGTELLLFEAIMSYPHGFSFPPPTVMDADAARLCEELLQKEAEQRIGAIQNIQCSARQQQAREGGENNARERTVCYDAIWAHPFLAPVVQTVRVPEHGPAPPLPPVAITLPPLAPFERRLSKSSKEIFSSGAVGSLDDNPFGDDLHEATLVGGRRSSKSAWELHIEGGLGPGEELKRVGKIRKKGRLW